MNVYKCERIGIADSRRVVIVAANSRTEAFEVCSKEMARYDVCSEFGDTYYSGNFYPLADFGIMPELVANCDEPKVLIEAGYTE